MAEIKILEQFLTDHRFVRLRGAMCVAGSGYCYLLSPGFSVFSRALTILLVNKKILLSGIPQSGNIRRF